MAGEEQIERWVEAYKKAWASDAADDIRLLFTDDAEYYAGPFEEPWRGPDEIVTRWLEHTDSELEWTFRYEILGVAGNMGIVQGWTDYTSPNFQHSYANLWLIELDEGGRARSFKEWWIEDPKTKD